MSTAEALPQHSVDRPLSLLDVLKHVAWKTICPPDTIGVLMQRFDSFSQVNDNNEAVREAARLYPLFLAQYKTGLKNYRISALAHRLEFKGILTHDTYPNQRLVVEDGKCMCVYEDMKASNLGKVSGDRVHITGSADGQAVHVVEYQRVLNDKTVSHRRIDYAYSKWTAV